MLTETAWKELAVVEVHNSHAYYVSITYVPAAKKPKEPCPQAFFCFRVRTKCRKENSLQDG